MLAVVTIIITVGAHMSWNGVNTGDAVLQNTQYNCSHLRLA